VRKFKNEPKNSAKINDIGFCDVAHLTAQGLFFIRDPGIRNEALFRGVFGANPFTTKAVISKNEAKNRKKDKQLSAVYARF